MRTLSEVIEIASDWTNGFDEMSIEKQMLHYLKEYKEMKEHLACLDAATLHGEDTQRVNNPVLTWQELKGMEGKPVWVEYGISFNQKRWVVIHSFHNTGSFCYMDVHGNYPNTFWQKDMGEDEFWQAYRMERKNEDS